MTIANENLALENTDFPLQNSSSKMIAVWIKLWKANSTKSNIKFKTKIVHWNLKLITLFTVLFVAVKECMNIVT